MSDQKQPSGTVRAPTDAELNVGMEEEVLNAPVIHIDGLAGLMSWNGAIRINCYQDRLTVGGDGTGLPLKRVICARLVMSPSTLLAINQWLGPKAGDIQALMGKDTAKDLKNGEQ